MRMYLETTPLPQGSVGWRDRKEVKRTSFWVGTPKDIPWGVSGGWQVGPLMGLGVPFEGGSEQKRLGGNGVLVFWYENMYLPQIHNSENKRSSLESIYVFDMSVSRFKLTGCPSPVPS